MRVLRWQLSKIEQMLRQRAMALGAMGDDFIQVHAVPLAKVRHAVVPSARYGLTSWRSESHGAAGSQTRNTPAPSGC